MKTILICLALALLALTFGLLRQPRLAELKKQVAEHVAKQGPDRTVNAIVDTETTRSFRSKKTTNGTSPAASLTSYITHKHSNSGVSGGAGSVMENREAFAEIMKLDLEGKHEFIRLVIRSEDTAFADNLHRAEAINLCLCAMANHNPEEALAYLLNSDEKIGSFYADRMPIDSMVLYITVRLADLNPSAASEELLKIASREKPILNVDWYSQIIDSIADRQPELAFETISRLPKDQQIPSWKAVIQKADTPEQLNNLFDAIRRTPLDDKAALTGLLHQIFRQKRDDDKSWTFFSTWLSERNLTEKEKQFVAPALVSVLDVHEPPKVAEWLINGLPQSQERDFLIWRMTQGYWEATDPVAASKLLEEHSINSEEMHKLDREGFMRIDF